MHSVAFGLPHEGWRGFDAQVPDLGLKVVAHIDAAVVMAQPQARGAAAGETAEVLSDSLPDRLQRFESGGFLHRVDADAFGCTVINGGEDGDGAFSLGEGGRGISSPHPVGHFGNDRPIVRVCSSRLGLPSWGKQLVAAQQPQDAVLASAHTFVAQAHPDLAIAFRRRTQAQPGKPRISTNQFLRQNRATFSSASAGSAQILFALASS